MLTTYAQEKYKITPNDYNNTLVAMADQLRAEGKIYVVVGILVVIFLGLMVCVWSIDKKITALKKMFQNKKM